MSKYLRKIFFLSFYILLKSKCLVNNILNIYIYIKCISKLNRVE